MQTKAINEARKSLYLYIYFKNNYKSKVALKYIHKSCNYFKIFIYQGI